MSDDCEHEETYSKEVPEYPSIPAYAGQDWERKEYCRHCGAVVA